VVDNINASPNWEAILHGTLRSWSSNGTLLVLGVTTGNLLTEAGHDLLLDSSVALIGGLFAFPMSIGYEWNPNGRLDDRRSNPLGELESRKWNELRYLRANVTAAATVTSFRIYTVGLDGTETLNSEEVGAATTVEFERKFGEQHRSFRTSRSGERLLAVYTSSVSPTAGFIEVAGASFKYGATDVDNWRT
jgi:hypothetical protein